MSHRRTDSATPRRTSGPGPSVRLPMMLWMCVLIVVSGCRSAGELGLFSRRNSLTTDGITGPLERALLGEEDPFAMGEKFSPEEQANVTAARDLFQDGNYPEALKAYKALSKKYEKTSIGEEAWFHIGECYFAMKQYAKAQDAYDKLFADYPSTKYVADTSQRLFEIAKIWLEVTDPVAKTKVKLASDTKEVDGPAQQQAASHDPTVRFGLLPNFHDKTRPVFDTAGRARNALKAIWLNDPTGPLADDALMLTAAYYLKRNNYMEADRYLEILRDEYPDSPHLEDAFVLGGHVRQLAYQGPYYDGTTLISAENLKERTLQMFPNTRDREQIRKDLRQIYAMKAQDAWANVEFYQRKGNPRAVAIQCIQVVNDYPDTRYAELARRELLKTNPQIVRDLPGVSEFIASLPKEPMGPPAPSESEERRPPVKSVSSSEPPGV
ncbi:MAG: outer membrane protein assembly factor BamD [Planctomycetaceae bacterium]|nr:outer membrane protein assembly factor BamD [Planctomycetaceae bacterium]